MAHHSSFCFSVARLVLKSLLEAGRKKKHCMGGKLEKAFTSVRTGLARPAGHEDVEPLVDDRFIPGCSG